jgi:hypothetical protein
MAGERQVDSPVKSMCVMKDVTHLCTGSFDGSIAMWNIKVYNKIIMIINKINKRIKIIKLVPGRLPMH